MKANRCICLITYKPDTIWLDFLSRFKTYDIYVVIDDNKKDYNSAYSSIYPNIKFIQIVNNECEKNGFVNVNYLMRKNVTGWEKALYYFSRTENKYPKVWFIEDDVFLQSENTLKNIDKFYPDSDLLAAKCLKKSACKSWPHWKAITINFKPPYFKSMVCATRLSDKLLSHINLYASTNSTLFFLEALFPTLAKKNKLLYHCPAELSTVVWRKDWKIGQLNSKNIYHPIKEINLHIEHRRKPITRLLLKSTIFTYLSQLLQRILKKVH